MTNVSVETQAVPEALLHQDDLTAPSQEIPEIDPIGTRDDIDASDEETLIAKFEEYALGAPIVVEHHDYERERFEDIYEHYVKIFTSLETLETIKLTTEAVAPGFDLFEEFELIDLPSGLARASAVIGKVTLYGGGVAAVVGFGKAAWQSRQATQALAAARGKPIGAPNSPTAVKAAKNASRWKVLGAVGTLLTVGSAAVGIVATIENEKRRMQFLRDSVASYQDWYTSTRQSIDELSAGFTQMDAAISELMELLGYQTVEELEAFLGDAVQEAGEIQGALKSATRMLCADPPLSVAQVASFTGLPSATISRRKALIDNDPSLCTLGV